MTLSTALSRVDCPGNGAATVFSFAPVVIFTAADLLVVKRDAVGNETVIAPGAGTANYSLGFSSFPGTGSITYPATGSGRLALGEKLVIKRLVPLLQNTRLENQGAYLPRVLESTMDYDMAIDQQQQEQLNRTITTATTDPATQLILPSSVARANKIMGFDSAGAPVALAPVATALSFLGNGPFVSVTQFGAVCDGVTNDAAAIQAAVNSVGALGGGTVYIPGHLCAISTTINVHYNNVKIVGAGRGGFSNVAPFFTPGGTNLIWTGANSGTMINIEPMGSQRIIGWGVTDIALIGGAFPFATDALIGLQIWSSAFGKADITTMEFSGGHVVMKVKAGLGAGESCNNEGNEISINFRALSTTGAVLILSGQSGLGNTALNHFPSIRGEYLDGDVIILGQCDNNRFTYVSGYKAAGGTGHLMLFLGGTVANTDFARANIFDWVSAQTGGCNIQVQGTDTPGVTVPSVNNGIIFWDYENDIPVIQTGTGSSFWYGSDRAPIGKNFENFSPSATVGYGASVTTSRLADVWGVASAGGAGTQTISVQVAGNVAVLGVQNVQVSPRGTVQAYATNYTLNTFDLVAAGAGNFDWRAVVI